MICFIVIAIRTAVIVAVSRVAVMIMILACTGIVMTSRRISLSGMSRDRNTEK
jgi:hypothetical protein